MGTFLLQLVFKVISAELTKTAIGYGVNKLLEHTEDGITKDIAEVMINGVAKSKANPTTTDLFTDAMLVLKQG